jgi:hypothetical protein
MYYEIEAIRWNHQGHITHVRWRAIDVTEQGLVRGDSCEVPVVDAAEVCRNNEVRVYVPGAAGRFFTMKACPEGIDAEVDEAGTPLRERMAHLPTF